MSADQSSQSDNLEEIPDPPALKRLRRAVRARRDLASPGHVGRQIGRLIRDPGIRTRDLLDVALADPAVVIRLIRMVNASNYRTRDRSEVLSIQRAIELMGQTKVRNDVTALPKIDKVIKPDRLSIVLNEFAGMALCARLARNILDTRNPLVSDEGSVIAMFARLWPVMGALHLPDEMAVFRFVQQHDARQVDFVHRELLGMPAMLLHREVLESAGLPMSGYEVIVQTDQRPVPVIAGRDWLPLAVGISVRVVEAINRETVEQRDQCIRDIVFRYRHCVDLDEQSLVELIEESAYEAISMERSSGASESESYMSGFLMPFLKREPSDDSGWAYFSQLDSTGLIAKTKGKLLRRQTNGGHGGSEQVIRTATGRPTDSAERIATWASHMNRVIEGYANGQRVKFEGSDADDLLPAERIVQRILPPVLTGIHSALGYDRVIWFNRVGRTDLFDLTAGVGSGVDQIGREVAKNLRCDGLILAAQINKADVHIADTDVPKIRENLPPWIDNISPNSRSFLLLPVVGSVSSNGFLLATRSCTDPDGIADEELSSIIEVRNRLAELFDEFCETEVSN